MRTKSDGNVLKRSGTATRHPHEWCTIIGILICVGAKLLPKRAPCLEKS
jgi:hypothetical protein